MKQENVLINCLDCDAKPAYTGETVSIYHIPVMRRPFIEGRARIIEAVRGLSDLYRVQFEGEYVTRLRLVHGGIWQSDPEAMSEALLNHFRVSLMPELLVELPANLSTRGTSGRR